MKKLLSLSAGLIGLTLVMSCNKQATPIKQVKQQHSLARESDFEVTNGWLNFSSFEAMDNTVTTLFATDDSDLATWYNGISGFTSLAGYYDQLDDAADNETGDASSDSLFNSGALIQISDLRFASILNSKGILQVDTIIYHVGDDTLYSVSSTNVSIAINEDWQNPLVSRSPYHDVAPCGGNFTHTWDTYKDDNGNDFPKRNGRQTRLRQQAWNHNYIIYSSWGVEVYQQRHTRFAGWVNNTSCDIINISSSVSGQLNRGGTPPVNVNYNTPSPFQQSPCLKLSKTFDHYVGKPVFKFCFYPNWLFSGYGTYHGATAHFSHSF